jgi:uncharacterized protein (TIGR02145 family)
MSQTEADNYGFRGAQNEGGKLKEIETSHWKYPNQGATNQSHFNGLPGGYHSAVFQNLTKYARFWTSSWDVGSNKGYRILTYNYSMIGRGFDYGSSNSLRCIKN